MRHIRQIYRVPYVIVITLILTIHFVNCFSKSIYSDPSINLLLWNGILSTPKLLHRIESECKVNLSIDECNFDDDFFRSLHYFSNRFDIIIASEEIYRMIPYLVNKSIGSTPDNKNYLPPFSQLYKKFNYPLNVHFFSHDVYGFLYDNYKISSDYFKSLNKLLNSSLNKGNVYIDDSPYGAILLKKFIQNNESKQMYYQDNFKNLYIGTDLENKIFSKNFILAYTTFSSASYLMAIYKNLNFYLHPEVSFLKTDLLIQLHNSSHVNCVINSLLGKELSDYIVNAKRHVRPSQHLPTLLENQIKQIKPTQTVDLNEYFSLKVYIENFKYALMSWQSNL